MTNLARDEGFLRWRRALIILSSMNCSFLIDLIVYRLLLIMRPLSLLLIR